MKFTVSTQMSPVKRTAVEIIKFVDIGEHLSRDEVGIKAAELEQSLKGGRVGDSCSLTLRKGVELDETVVVTVAELSEAEQVALVKKDIDDRRHKSGYTYGEWERLSKGGASYDRGIKQIEWASEYALPILDENNVEVDRLTHEGELATREVSLTTARQMFEKWIDEKLYADDPEKLLEVFFDDDYPYEAVLHCPDCLPNLSRHRKRRFYKLDVDGGFEWDIEGSLVQIPIEKCEGCRPSQTESDTSIVPF